MNRLYNEDELRHSDVIKNLRDLPKIKAPENFELNLMTRIQNRNFGDVAKERPRFNYFRFFAPSAVVAGALLLFLIFLKPNPQIPGNPYTSAPPDLSQRIADNSGVIKDELKSGSLRKYKVTHKDDNLASLPEPTPADKPELNNSANSIRVDDFISGKSNSRDIAKGSVVSSNPDAGNIEGFFVKKKLDAETLKRYREVVDSLRRAQDKLDALMRAQHKLDSLKKAAELPE
jgi:hypothetical protein